jgi:hypothetical protein
MMIDASQPKGVHNGYYSRNPKWHRYGKPEFLSHARLIEARSHNREASRTGYESEACRPGFVPD